MGVTVVRIAVPRSRAATPDRGSGFEDFSRYDQGAPWEGFDEKEAQDKYRRVAPKLSPDLYQESAQESFSRLTTEQRFELGRQLQASARREGLRFDADDDGLRDPKRLARATSRIHQERPDVLEQLLAGGGGSGAGLGGMLSGSVGKAALGGIAAIAVQKLLSKRR